MSSTLPGVASAVLVGSTVTGRRPRCVDVLFVGQPDSMTPLGTKGIGELAITGTRVRSLPISIEKVLGHGR